MKNDNNSILKSSFFLKLFIVPSICLIILSLMAMIPDEAETDPLTWGDLIIVDLVMLIIWFNISYAISLLVREIKNNLIDKIGNVNFIDEGNYFLTEYYIIVLDKKNVLCFDYSKIKEIYKEYIQDIISYILTKNQNIEIDDEILKNRNKLILNL